MTAAIDILRRHREEALDTWNRFIRQRNDDQTAFAAFYFHAVNTAVAEIEKYMHENGVEIEAAETAGGEERT